MRIENINIYPIKSIAAIETTRATVEPRGLAGDRRFLLVDENQRFMTGRLHPSLVHVRAQFTDQGVRVNAPGQEALEIAIPDADAAGLDIRIWRDDVQGRHVSADADQWFTRYLGVRCTLVYQHENDQRIVIPATNTRSDDTVSFADGYPLLLTSTASLDDLNTRLDAPVAMTNFRTNLVAQTDEPYAEDHWSRIRIGKVEFDMVKRCARCVFTTVDPLTGQRNADGEPLKTLRSYRLDKSARGALFGVNLVPRSHGILETGMAIEVLA